MPRACQPNIRIAPNRFTRPLLLVIVHIPSISLTYLVWYVFGTRANAQFKCANVLSTRNKLKGWFWSGLQMPGLLKCRGVLVWAFRNTCMHVNEATKRSRGDMSNVICSRTKTTWRDYARVSSEGLAPNDGNYPAVSLSMPEHSARAWPLHAFLHPA